MWIEIPVLFEKEGQPNFADLGINDVAELEETKVMMNISHIEAFNASTHEDQSTIHTGALAYRVNLKYDDLKTLILAANG
ncbi:hypothetical protein BWD42_04075 [Sphingobacterium sp. CZ-UAM]|uniref:hypothetical protein n=1 Tax=Sphingobacterium sp. CZ-UAM TaxID=1933868 RepID=UPI00098410B8|nr:hypothetical protein [Sphingobacterium sp. CZ-UAM]OOG19135.1 hypothetical protein BWD42_04075 [Sphingobacterium sp. CZ-UAM]